MPRSVTPREMEGVLGAYDSQHGRPPRSFSGAPPMWRRAVSLAGAGAALASAYRRSLAVRAMQGAVVECRLLGEVEDERMVDEEEGGEGRRVDSGGATSASRQDATLTGCSFSVSPISGQVSGLRALVLYAFAVAVGIPFDVLITPEASELRGRNMRMRAASASSTRTREALAGDGRVRHAIEYLFKAAEADTPGEGVSRGAYVRFVCALWRALVEDSLSISKGRLSDASIVAKAEDFWIADVAAAGVTSCVRSPYFFDLVLDFAETWVRSREPSDVAGFLESLGAILCGAEKQPRVIELDRIGPLSVALSDSVAKRPEAIEMCLTVGAHNGEAPLPVDEAAALALRGWAACELRVQHPVFAASLWNLGRTGWSMDAPVAEKLHAADGTWPQAPPSGRMVVPPRSHAASGEHMAKDAASIELKFVQGKYEGDLLMHNRRQGALTRRVRPSLGSGMPPALAARSSSVQNVKSESLEVHQGLVGLSNPVEYNAPFCRSTKLTESQTARFRPHTLQGMRTRSQRPESAAAKVRHPSRPATAAERPRSATVARLSSVPGSQLLGQNFIEDRRRQINEEAVVPRVVMRPMSSQPALREGISQGGLNPHSLRKSAGRPSQSIGNPQTLTPESFEATERVFLFRRQGAERSLVHSSHGPDSARNRSQRDFDVSDNMRPASSGHMAARTESPGHLATPSMRRSETTKSRPMHARAPLVRNGRAAVYGAPALRDFRLEYHSLVAPQHKNAVPSTLSSASASITQSQSLRLHVRTDAGGRPAGVPALDLERGFAAALPARGFGRVAPSARSQSARTTAAAVPARQQHGHMSARPALRGTEFGSRPSSAMASNRVGGEDLARGQQGRTTDIDENVLGPSSIVNYLVEPGMHALFNTLFPGSRAYVAPSRRGDGVGGSTSDGPTSARGAVQAHSPRRESSNSRAPGGTSPPQQRPLSHRSGGADNLNFVDENARRARQLLELRLRVDLLKRGPPEGATVIM